MSRKNPYDAPVPRSLRPDDATEVTLDPGGSVLPVDDETNFGSLSRPTDEDLAPDALAQDPRKLAELLTKQARKRPPVRSATPIARSRLRQSGRGSKKPAPPRTVPARRTLEEDAPTRTDAFPPEEEAAPVDPRQLARQLAEEAKRRLAKAPAPESPAAPTESPAALAQRLAAEAMARLNAAPPTKPLAEPDPAPPAPSAPPVAPPAPAKPAPPTSSLASRSPRRKSTTSAKQALESLSSRPAPQRQAAPPPPPEPVEVAAKPDRRKKPRPATSVPPPDEPTYLSELLHLFPGARIVRERPVLKPRVFVALWEAHQARATKVGDLPLALTANRLVARANVGGPVGIVGVQIIHRDTDWAVFVDQEDGGRILGIVPQPEIYLAGLQ